VEVVVVPEIICVVGRTPVLNWMCVASATVV